MNLITSCERVVLRSGFDTRIFQSSNYPIVLGFDLRDDTNPQSGVWINEANGASQTTHKLVLLPIETKGFDKDGRMIATWGNIPNCCTLLTYFGDTPISPGFGIALIPDLNTSEEAIKILEDGNIARVFDELRESEGNIFFIRSGSERLFLYKYPDSVNFGSEPYKNFLSKYQSLGIASLDAVAVAIPGDADPRVLPQDRMLVPDPINTLETEGAIIRWFPGSSVTANSEFIAIRYVLSLSQAQKDLVDALPALFAAVLTPLVGITLSAQKSTKKWVNWLTTISLILGILIELGIIGLIVWSAAQGEFDSKAVINIFVAILGGIFTGFLGWRKTVNDKQKGVTN